MRLLFGEKDANLRRVVALAQQGADSASILGHSFRIQAATAAARAGLEDSSIQSLGQWHSVADLGGAMAPKNSSL